MLMFFSSVVWIACSFIQVNSCGSEFYSRQGQLILKFEN